MTLPAKPADPAIAAALAAVDEAMQTLAAVRALLAGRLRRRGATAETHFDRAFREATPVRSKPFEDMAMTVREAAAMLGVTEEYVRRQLRSGEMLGIPFGGRMGWRLSRTYVAELAAKRGRGSRRVARRTAARR